jgi:hypothetical protein
MRQRPAIVGLRVEKARGDKQFGGFHLIDFDT